MAYCTTVDLLIGDIPTSAERGSPVGIPPRKDHDDSAAGQSRPRKIQAAQKADE